MIKALSEENISGKVLDHLGLVAATIHQLDLIKKIDKRLPISQEKGAKVSMGERVAAMILNGLGFIDDRLYLFPEFLKNKPIKSLLARDIPAEAFNDDALGRCLDEISDYGVTPLFTEVAFEIGHEQHLLGKSAHFDTSTLSVYGEYEENSTDVSAPELSSIAAHSNTESAIVEKKEETKIPRVTYGYSKAKRPDLKQMVINLATTGQAGFPLWMESHDGNASDKKILAEAAVRMKAFCEQLKAAPDFLYVGDSAMYSHCIRDNLEMKWLSRVPENKAAKALLSHDENVFGWSALEEGYRFCTIETQEGGVHQRWVIIDSSHAHQRESITLEKNIAKEYKALKNSYWHLSHQAFTCENDARAAGLTLHKKIKYHSVTFDIKTVNKHETKGRPKKGEVPTKTFYSIDATVSRDEEKIKPIYHRKGRFILATNQLDRALLPDSLVLSEYKAQSKTESGFKFIKDDTFEVDSIFLKSPKRISALMMVMTLCLMVYAVAQHQLRQALISHDDTVLNQKGKPTQNPSMKWIYRLFHGVQVLSITLEEHVQELVINLNAQLKKIIRYFGDYAMNVYGVPSG